MAQEINPKQTELKEDGITAEPTQALVRRVPRAYAEHYNREGLSISEEHVEQQHREYVRALESAGLKVSYVKADEDMPDCVFIEDTAVVLKRHALITGVIERRQQELDAVEELLRKTHAVSRLSGDARLEGGDVLHIGETTYVGLSSRTNELGADALEAFLSEFGRKTVKMCRESGIAPTPKF